MLVSFILPHECWIASLLHAWFLRYRRRWKDSLPAVAISSYLLSSKQKKNRKCSNHCIETKALCMSPSCSKSQAEPLCHACLLHTLSRVLDSWLAGWDATNPMESMVSDSECWITIEIYTQKVLEQSRNAKYSCEFLLSSSTVCMHFYAEARSTVCTVCSTVCCKKWTCSFSRLFCYASIPYMVYGIWYKYIQTHTNVCKCNQKSAWI